MTITAKFASKCPECRQSINVGDKVEWNRGAKAVHITCPISVEEKARTWSAADEARIGTELSAIYHPTASTDADDRSYDAWLVFLASQPKPRLAVEDAGVYVLPNGSIVKVQANREKTRTYALRWVSTLGNRLTLASTVEHGEYRYVIGLVDEVAATGRKMTLEEARQFIILYGQCCRCGRKLVDATSVERGIGPVCIKYFTAGTTGADLLTAPAALSFECGCGNTACSPGFCLTYDTPAYDDHPADRAYARAQVRESVYSNMEGTGWSL